MTGVVRLTDAAGQTAAVTIEAAPGGPTAAPTTGLGEAVGLAFLGGLLLNLMPCVFPILAIKAAGLARTATAPRREAWVQASAYAAGVMTTFAAIGGALMAARAGGSGGGLGFPVPVADLRRRHGRADACRRTELLGVFTVSIGASGRGDGLARRGGIVGSFFTGLLAVLVATPCTAPFMAVALGAALAAPPLFALAVFLAMGAGMAAPFAALAVLPGVARHLPRPGRWMDVLRQALAFPMFGTAAWLVWVVAVQAGPDGVVLTASSCVLIGAAGWMAGLAQASGYRRAYIGTGLALTAAAILVGRIELAPAAAFPAEAGAEAFTAERLAALREAGRPVFVNMTAAWCVTCLVNERVALAPASVRAAFAARGVAYLKGDWTRQDREVGAYLHAQGRDGVPLYVVYPAHGGAAVTLPQILTPGTVLDAIGAGGTG